MHVPATAEKTLLISAHFCAVCPLPDNFCAFQPVQEVKALEVKMRFARVIFMIAGVWGVLVLIPLFFLLDTFNRLTPPPVTHAEYYYGFAAVALVFQLIFFVICSDPARFRPMMIPSVFEKLSYTTIVVLFYMQGRVDGRLLCFGIVDGLLGLAFLIAFFATRQQPKALSAKTSATF
jgi:hypothetical protein